MDRAVNEEFTDYLFQKANEAKRDIGYNPSYFLQMLGEDGGYQTAIKLLTPGRGVSDGFAKLYERGRLDLSVEAICLDPRWASYFDTIYLEEARTRLTQSNYQFEHVVATGLPWSKHECELVTADYFDMLKSQSENQLFSKSEHIAELSSKLNGRSSGSIGKKYSNISAVLVEIGIPYLDGYKPLANYQGALHDTVAAYVERNTSMVETILGQFQNVLVPHHETKSFESVIDKIPLMREVKKSRVSKEFKPKKIDFVSLAMRDLANKKLGHAGEEFVFNIEKDRLVSLGRNDLAEKVHWTSRDDGDGAGYDILSSEIDGRSRYIEVKTTNGPASTSFLVTKNEFEFAAANTDLFYIYRVHSFSNKPRLFIISFPIDGKASIEPSVYRVSF